MTLSIVHAFPNSFLPLEGTELRMKGISEQQVVKVVTSYQQVRCYIRYQDMLDRIHDELGIRLNQDGLNCPPPNSWNDVLLCSMSPGSDVIKYVLISCRKARFPHDIYTVDGSHYVAHSSADGEEFYVPNSEYMRDFMYKPEGAMSFEDLYPHILKCVDCCGDTLSSEEIELAR